MRRMLAKQANASEATCGRIRLKFNSGPASRPCLSAASFGGIPDYPIEITYFPRETSVRANLVRAVSQAWCPAAGVRVLLNPMHKGNSDGNQLDGIQENWQGCSRSQSSHPKCILLEDFYIEIHPAGATTA